MNCGRGTMRVKACDYCACINLYAENEFLKVL